MKIVDVCEFYARAGGGVHNYIEQKFDQAERHRHEITVVAPGPDNAVERRGRGKLVWVKAPVIPMDRNYHMFRRAEDVWRILDAEDPDLVEGSSPWRGGWLVAQWPGRAAKVLFMHSDPVAVYAQTWLGPILGRERTDQAFGWFWRYLRNLNAHFDATIVAAGWLAHRFATFGLTRIQTVPFGIERAKFNPGRRDLNLRRELLARCGLSETASLLVAIGRHHPEKRFDLLINAVAVAQRSRPIGLIILGDGMIRARIERWAAKGSHVVVAGQTPREELARILASADALLHGSSAETFGFAVAESICAGTPIIVPDQGGAASFAEPGYADAYRMGDRKGAAEAILRALSKDRMAQAPLMADAASRLVGSVEDHFDRLFDVYESLRSKRNERLVALAAASRISSVTESGLRAQSGGAN